MTRKKISPQADDGNGEEKLVTASSLGGKYNLVSFRVWLIGDMPLITHAWSEKAKKEMLDKQLGKTKQGREAKNPEQDFEDSLYPMGKDIYGFPAMGVKNCLLAGAHKDKNIPKTEVLSSLWIQGDMTRLMPSREKAICDMPLIRIYGDKPLMREDMVKIGSGLSKTANLAYRGQFTVWAMQIKGRFNPAVLNIEKLAVLINDGGVSCGLGEWRNERRGPFGQFHLASAAESAAWDRFKEGKGPLPIPEDHFLQAAE